MKLLHRHNEQIEEIQKLTSELEKSPAFRKMREEQAVETLAKREKAGEKIKALEKEQAEVVPKLQKDLAAKEDKFHKTKALMDAASDEAKIAKVAVMSQSQSFEKAISKQAEILIETADPALDAAIIFFNKKLSYLRSPGRIDHVAGGAERNIFTDTKKVKAESNVDAVKLALEYCRAAITELEKMKLWPVLDVEKIERMKAGVPSIDVYTEVTGKKPLPGSKGVNPRHLLPSDSELGWRRDNLMEKAKKLLKR